ncbi:MAG: DUF6691 family protein [Gemmatimonadota bacterium]
MTTPTTAGLPPISETEPARGTRDTLGRLLVYLLLGTAFGIMLIKSEVVSWFRIQEMFRFQGFHMYGILGSAVAVAALSMYVIRRARMRTIAGEPISVPPKTMGKGIRYAAGGTTFGVGWALTGACPGPILALIGYGIGPFLFVLASALVGTWTYGQLRPRLPH